MDAKEQVLNDFLKFVDEQTTFFEDKDVTISQVVDAYLQQNRAAQKCTCSGSSTNITPRECCPIHSLSNAYGMHKHPEKVSNFLTNH